jgi:hypothetical protein
MYIRFCPQKRRINVAVYVDLIGRGVSNLKLVDIGVGE